MSVLYGGHDPLVPGKPRTHVPGRLSASAWLPSKRSEVRGGTERWSVPNPDSWNRDVLYGGHDAVVPGKPRTHVPGGFPRAHGFLPKEVKAEVARTVGACPNLTHGIGDERDSDGTRIKAVDGTIQGSGLDLDDRGQTDSPTSRFRLPTPFVFFVQLVELKKRHQPIFSHLFGGQGAAQASNQDGKAHGLSTETA
ncbi:hypothetical protein OSTOST_04324 [Ostertagia ostertagi]